MLALAGKEFFLAARSNDKDPGRLEWSEGPCTSNCGKECQAPGIVAAGAAEDDREDSSAVCR